MNNLQEQVNSITKEISTGTYEYEPNEDYEECCVGDYLKDALDIEYVVNSKGEYKGARVCVALGGPDIWINTRTHTVEGCWWNERVRADFTDEMGIDGYLEEIYNCSKEELNVHIAEYKGRILYRISAW